MTIEDKVAFREFQNVTVGSISKNKNIDLRCRRLYNCVQSHGGATSKQLHASSESVTSGCFSIFPLPNMIGGGQQ